MRLILGLLAGAAVAVLGALLLGEYPFSGLPILGGGALLGAFVAEVGVGVGRRRGWSPAIACAGLAVIGMTWAGWISEGHHLSRLPLGGWLAVVVAGAVAAVMARSSRRAAGSRPEPAPRG